VTVIVTVGLRDHYRKALKELLLKLWETVMELREHRRKFIQRHNSIYLEDPSANVCSGDTEGLKNVS
jgi:hypothetical protein